MIGRLWRLFKTRRLAKKFPSPRFYKVGGGWGDRIEWWKPGKTVVGWKDSTPRRGDVLLSPMASGLTGRFRFVSVQRETDPDDMFFADVQFEGYQLREEKP